MTLLIAGKYRDSDERMYTKAVLRFPRFTLNNIYDIWLKIYLSFLSPEDILFLWTITFGT